MGNLTFAIQVKNIRLNANMTMEQFATDLGVTKSSVNMWENKGVVPRDEVLRQIATKYDVSLDTLFDIAEVLDIPPFRFLDFDDE